MLKKLLWKSALRFYVLAKTELIAQVLKLDSLITLGNRDFTNKYSYTLYKN